MAKCKSRRKRRQIRESKMNKVLIVMIGGLLTMFALAGYQMVKSRQPVSQTVDLRIGECVIKVEIADTPQRRQKGLSRRDHLKAGHGMLFVFESPRKLNFWMKDTSIPLSIAFISSEGVILQVEQMDPYDLRQVISDSPVQYALEVSRGFFQENGITLGTHVDLSNVTKK